MTVKFYNVSDPPEVVQKTLGNAREFADVRFLEPDCLNVQNPIIIINLASTNIDNAIENLVRYNYCYIAKFARYYWIDNIKTENALVRIELSVDPLMSFKNDIIGSVQYVSRSQNVINRKLVDPMLPIQSDHVIYIKPFGADVYKENCTNVILETTGLGQGGVD